MRPRDTAHLVPDTQLLDGYVLAGHLGILDRPYMVDFDVHAEPWSWRKDRYTPRQLAELWRRQLALPAVSPDFPVGLYLHVPFCTHTCSFCRCFRLRLASDRGVLDRYVDYVCAQMDFFAPTFAEIPIRYFSVGGGTPSMLSPDQLRRLLRRLYDRFDVRRENPLSTFEMSLPTARDATLDALAELEIPRVSIGVQTLDPQLRRRSDMFAIDRALLANRVAAVRARGLSCNLDLVLGLPGESAAQFLAGFHALLDMGPSSVVVNLLNANYFQREATRLDAAARDAASAFLREAGEGMAAAAVASGYAVYPHGNTLEAVAFFAPDFDRQVQPHWDILQRLAGGVLAVQVGTSVLALGSICNVAVLPDYLIACYDQDYDFDPDRVTYQCSRREVYSILYPKAEDQGPLFTAEQLVMLDPFVARLRTSTKVEVMPAPDEVLIEFTDAGQVDGRGRVFIRPFLEGRPCGMHVGTFAVVYNDARTPVTAAVMRAVRQWLEDAQRA